MAILDDFKNYLTLKDYNLNYYYRIKPFLIFCDQQKIIYDQITFSDLQNYFLTLRNKQYDNGTINNHIKAVRSFYKFLIDHNLAQEKTLELIYKIKELKYNRKIKDYITKEELGEIIEMGETFYYPMDPLKLKALLYFLFYTGLRKNELVNLKRIDVDLMSRSVIVRIPTKNREERVVFFPKKIKGTSSNPVIDFPQLLGDYFASEAEINNAFNVTVRQLDYMIKILKDFAPHKNLTLHTFRHSFARMLASKRIDSRIAQKLLGHKDIESTLIYYDPDIDVIQDIYKEKVD